MLKELGEKINDVNAVRSFYVSNPVVYSDTEKTDIEKSLEGVKKYQALGGVLKGAYAEFKTLRLEVTPQVAWGTFWVKTTMNIEGQGISELEMMDVIVFKKEGSAWKIALEVTVTPPSPAEE